MKIESPHNICIWSQIIQLAGSLDTLRGIFANMYWTFGAAPPPRELMWLSETARAEYQPDSVNRSVWYTPCIDFCRTPISLPTAPTTLCMRNPPPCSIYNIPRLCDIKIDKGSSLWSDNFEQSVSATSCLANNNWMEQMSLCKMSSFKIKLFSRFEALENYWAFNNNQRYIDRRCGTAQCVLCSVYFLRNLTSSDLS